MSLIGSTFAYRVMPDVHVKLTAIKREDGVQRFKYMVLDAHLATRWLDQDRFNAWFMVVKQ
jgi:hypothetical protein